MEIALNKESKRKSAVAVALRGEERSFGSDALAVGVKHPQNCYFYLHANNKNVQWITFIQRTPRPRQVDWRVAIEARRRQDHHVRSTGS